MPIPYRPLKQIDSRTYSRFIEGTDVLIIDRIRGESTTTRYLWDDTVASIIQIGGGVRDNGTSPGDGVQIRLYGGDASLGGNGGDIISRPGLGEGNGLNGSTVIQDADGNEIWRFDTAGDLVAGTDNTYDIGKDLTAGPGLRPRKVFVGTEVVVGDTVTIGTDSITASGNLTITSTGLTVNVDPTAVVTLNGGLDVTGDLTTDDLTAKTLTSTTTLDVGTSVNVGTNAVIGTSVVIGNAVTIDADSITCSGNLTITPQGAGAVVIDGDLEITGSISAGTFTSSTFASNLLPSTPDVYDIGSTSAEWGDIYTSGTIHLGNSQAATITWTADGGGSFNLATSQNGLNLRAVGRVTLSNTQGNKGVLFDVSYNALMPINYGTDLGATLTEFEDAYLRGTIHLGAGQNATIRTGTGSPESSVTAPVGSLFLRNNGAASTTLYVKESGASNTGWVAYGRPEVVESTNDGRLSVDSSDPLGEAAGVGTIYFHRYAGKRIALYDGSSEWSYVEIPSSPVSLALSGGTASTPHDVFVYDSSGLTLELVAWTDDTTRATALAEQDGVKVQSGATNKRYVGTIYLDGSKQVTFNSSVRGVWNESNRVRWESAVTDGTDSWNYSTASWRQANGSSSNQVQIMLGRQTEAVSARALSNAYNASSQGNFASGVGIDSSTVNSAQTFGAVAAVTNDNAVAVATYEGRPAEGFRDIRWLEHAGSLGGSGTVTWVGDAGVSVLQTGLVVSSWH